MDLQLDGSNLCGINSLTFLEVWHVGCTTKVRTVDLCPKRQASGCIQPGLLRLQEEDSYDEADDVTGFIGLGFADGCVC